MVIQENPDRFVESATEQFAQLGFDGASLWGISRALGTTMSYITSHFGGKEQLYLACADYVAAQIGASQSPALAALREHPPANAQEARAHLLTMMDAFGRLMLSPETDAWQQFVVREQLHPSEAFDHLYALVMGPMLDAAISLMALARPSLDEMERRVQVMNMIGMGLMPSLARAAVCRVMNVDDIDEAMADTLLAGLNRAVHSLVTEDCP